MKTNSRPFARLESTHVFHGHEGEAEALHGVSLLLVVEDHPVGGQVEPALLLALEDGAVLAAEAHADLVAEEYDALAVMQENAVLRVGRVQRHGGREQGLLDFSQ